MNEGGNEVLLQECQTSKRPIDNYIDYFEEYQNHTLQAKKHLTYYLVPRSSIIEHGLRCYSVLPCLQNSIVSRLHFELMDLLPPFLFMVLDRSEVQ